MILAKMRNSAFTFEAIFFFEVIFIFKIVYILIGTLYTYDYVYFIGAICNHIIILVLL